MLLDIIMMNGVCETYYYPIITSPILVIVALHFGHLSHDMEHREHTTS